jgi:hypothetical protein
MIRIQSGLNFETMIISFFKKKKGEGLKTYRTINVMFASYSFQR